MKIDITDYRHVYAIGDLQGCFAALKALLKEIQFDPSQDFIIFTGDLLLLLNLLYLKKKNQRKRSYSRYF